MSALKTKSVRCAFNGCRNMTLDESGACYHHRSAGASVSPAMSPANLPLHQMLPDDRLPESLTFIIDDIDMEQDSIQFAVAEPAGDGEEFIRLNMMQYPDTARGNCMVASCEVLGYMQDGVEPGETAGLIGIRFERGMHYANIFTDVFSRQYVVDYTARQYDADLPFPWVVERSEWEAAVQGYVRDQYSDSAIDIVIE